MTPNDNKLNNNNTSDNKFSDTATAAPDNTAIPDPAPPPNTTAAAEAETKNNNRPSIPYSQIFDRYNEICLTTGLRPIRGIEGNRKTKVAAQFKQYGLSGFFDVFDKVTESAFLCGGGNRGWKADFDWLINPTNMQNVLEGKYDGSQSNTPAPQTPFETPYPSQSHSVFNSQNKTERYDPFMEGALSAYATAQAV